MQTFKIGDDRIVVIHDVGPNDYMEVLRDAANRRTEGWRMLSLDSLLTGFTGSAGNVLFNTGGGGATEVRYSVLFERAAD